METVTMLYSWMCQRPKRSLPTFEKDILLLLLPPLLQSLWLHSSSTNTWEPFLDYKHRFYKCKPEPESVNARSVLQFSYWISSYNWTAIICWFWLDLSHWFINYRFETMSLTFWPWATCFLSEVTIFGPEDGAGGGEYPDWIWLRTRGTFHVCN